MGGVVHHQTQPKEKHSFEYTISPERVSTTNLRIIVVGGVNEMRKGPSSEMIKCAKDLKRVKVIGETSFSNRLYERRSSWNRGKLK